MSVKGEKTFFRLPRYICMYCGKRKDLVVHSRSKKTGICASCARNQRKLDAFYKKVLKW